MSVCGASGGLADAGMAMIGEQAKALGVAPYPHMVRWLRE